MQLLKSGINLTKEIKSFIDNSSNLIIFSPYIKIETLKTLLYQSNCSAIVVRWEAKDLILGSSDIEVYDFCKENGIVLYRNSRLHLKAFINNYKSCIIGSCNISSRGLNLPINDNYNYETATNVDSLCLEDRLYFNKIINESILITDNIYYQIKEQTLELKENGELENSFTLNIQEPEKNFLVSALPLTYSFEELVGFYKNPTLMNEEQVNCFIHDLSLYNLSTNLSIEVFKKEINISFFNHPFIKAFLENLNINKEIYFGTAKEWIHSNCSNVPLPRKWEITENTQILYRWIVQMGNGLYKVDRPAHSERMFVV